MIYTAIKKIAQFALAVTLLGSASISFAQTTYSPPLKNGFQIENATAATFCKEKNASWVVRSKSTGTAVNQSVAIRISGVWALSFPDDLNTKVTSLTCGPLSTVTITAGTYSGGAQYWANANNADKLCAARGYSTHVSFTTNGYAGNGLATWESTTNNWVVYPIPFEHGQHLRTLNRITCNR